jgi:hypothetical protein
MCRKKEKKEKKKGEIRVGEMPYPESLRLSL